jgi:hypothetical protein
MRSLSSLGTTSALSLNRIRPPRPLRQRRVPPFRPVWVAGEPGFGEHHELRAVAPGLFDGGARARHARFPVHERRGFLGDGDLNLLPTAEHPLGRLR